MPTTKHPFLQFGRWVALVAVLFACSGVFASPAFSADVKKAKKKPAKEDDEEEELIVEDVVLDTEDGVQLNVRYYHGNDGKDSVPVLILHNINERSSNYEALALYLQQKRKCAVVVPDLRGHGDSTTQNINGQSVELTSRLKKQDLLNVVNFDVEAVRRFLVEQNNLERLNIEKLCVVGVEMGTVVAMNWAQLDWSWPNLPNKKQGKHVKALVLISPKNAVKGLSIEAPLKDKAVRSRLSMFIAVGEEDKRSFSQANRLHGNLEKYHPDPPAEDAKQLKTLFFFELETSLQGLKLLEQDHLKLKIMIGAFIQNRLINKTFKWAKR